MAKLALTLVAALALVCCNDDPKDLCQLLTNKCSANAGNTCRDNLKNEQSQHPDCSELVQAFSDCIASTTLTCSSDTEITATISGDKGNEPSPTNDTHLGSQHFVVHDSTCTLIKNGLDACRTCPTAAGAQEVAVHGVGEACGADTDCADKLKCDGGICTRECTDASDCYARADNCKMSATQTNTCSAAGATRMCTVSTVTQN